MSVISILFFAGFLIEQSEGLANGLALQCGTTSVWNVHGNCIFHSVDLLGGLRSKTINLRLAE